MAKDMEALWNKYITTAPVQAKTINGQPFLYRYYRNPDPETDATLVILAGGTGAGDGFFCFNDELEGFCSFLTFNYPIGYRDNIETADAIAVLLRQLDCHNIWLFGQSYGGLLAQIIAARHPQCVHGMILSSTISLSNDLQYAGMHRIAQMVGEKKERKNKRIDRILPMKLIPKFMRLAVRKHTDDPGLRAQIDAVFNKVSGTFSREYFMHMDTLLGDLRNHIGVYQPREYAYLEDRILIFSQADDKTWTKDMVEAMYRFYPRAVKAPDLKGGHLVMFARPEAYFGILKDFIRTLN